MEALALSGKDGSVLRDFLAGSASDQTGVRVASTYVDADSNADIVTAGGSGSVPQVGVYSGATGQPLPPPQDGFLAADPAALHGLFVAAAIDPPNLTVSWSAAEFPVNEDAGTIWLSIVLSAPAPASPPVQVWYQVTDGTAHAGVDYTLPRGSGQQSITFAPGHQRASVPVQILDDGSSPPEGNETINYSFVTTSGVTAVNPVSGTIIIDEPNHLPPPVPPDPPDCSCSSAGQPGDVFRDARGNVTGGLGRFTAAPVRYADGVVRLAATDLASGGFGLPWGQTRSWSNGPGYASGSDLGSGWVGTQLPSLLDANGDGNTIIAVSNDTTARYFDLVNGAYQPCPTDGN